MDDSSLNLAALLAYKRRGGRLTSEEADQRALRLKQAAADQPLYDREVSIEAWDSESSNEVQVLQVKPNKAATRHTIYSGSDSDREFSGPGYNSPPDLDVPPPSPPMSSRPTVPQMSLKVCQKSRRVLFKPNPHPQVTLDPLTTMTAP